MAKVKFKGKGVVVKVGNSEKPLSSLEDALQEQAKCHPCGCNSTLGYTTLTNAETGDLMLIWVSGKGTNGDPYQLNVGEQTTALVEIQLLNDYRCGKVTSLISHSISASASFSVSPSASVSLSKSPSSSASASVSPSGSVSLSKSPSASASPSASVSPSSSTSSSISDSTSPSSSRSPSSSVSPSA